jgi:ketosteroid isomerase-like protein
MAQHVSESRRFRPRILLVACAVVLCSTFVLVAQADGPHPKRKDQYKHQVEKLEEAWRIAQLNDDVDAMDRLLSDDYVGITMSGQVVTKTQQLDRMRTRNLVLTTITLGDVKVKLIGTTAIVTSLADVDGTNDGEPMHGTYRYTRVYSRLPSGIWKITNFEATRVGPPPPSRESREPHDKHSHSGDSKPGPGDSNPNPQMN